MKVSVDNQQRLTATGMMLLEFYKVLMGTFLVVFVPQQCGDEVCGLGDNISNNDALHRAALLNNLVTFAAVLVFYGVEVRRENWCIEYLDIDPDKPNNHLDEEIEAYPQIKNEMAIMNRRYIKALYAASGLLAANFGISSAAIFREYAGSSTITSLASFAILVAMKLYSAREVGIRSVEEECAFSGYLTIARTYNTIDADHVSPAEGHEPAASPGTVEVALADEPPRDCPPPAPMA
jgi:hypothetical protein